MMLDRQSFLLGELCRFSGGAGFAPKYQGAKTGDYPFIKVSDMELPGNEFRITTANNWVDEPTRLLLKAKAHPANATVFAKIGIALTYNRRRLLTRPTAIDNNMMAAIPDESRVDPRFLYYLLKQTDFNPVAGGTALPYLNASDLEKLKVQVPPLPEQKAIAQILGTLDDKIELNRRMNATLEAMARALFQSWFVDFDPVHAKAAARPPSGMDAATAALFPASFQDSELGEIPKGWSIQSLSELCSYLSRGIGPAYLETGGVLVLNQKCIRDHRVNTAPGRRHDNQKKPVKGRLVEKLDVLVNSTGVGTLGRVAQVLQIAEPTIVDSHVTIVRAAPGTDAHFLGVNLTGREPEIEGLGEGSTGQTELSRVRLGTLPVITPPSKIQNAFGRFARPIFERIAANENQSRTLATLRDTLLPKLLSGELSVAAVSAKVAATP